MVSHARLSSRDCWGPGLPTWTMAPTIFRASWYSLSPVHWGFRCFSSVASRLCSRIKRVCIAASLGVSDDRESP